MSWAMMNSRSSRTHHGMMQQAFPRLTLLAILGSSCADSQTSASSHHIALETIHQYAVTTCSKQRDCNCASREDHATCVERIEGELSTAVIRGVDDHGLFFDEDCPLQRSAFVDALDCATSWESGPISPACKLHFGTGAPGDSCELSPTADGDNCERGSFCLSGICRETRQRATLGDFCSPDIDRPCEDGLICESISNGSVVSTCIPLGSIGENCGECDCSLMCAGAECSPSLQDGSRCTVDIECNDGSSCVREVCTPLAEEGEECVAADYGDGLLCADGLCVPSEPVICQGPVKPLPRKDEAARAYCRG